ncbi:TPA: nucleotidyltransferase domain-containing protein [Candidatus Poribacteria bacterium]|nr:nucleotidyltransferase domain-containing protein [Candidatus Poribacteria bacterium]
MGDNFLSKDCSIAIAIFLILPFVVECVKMKFQAAEKIKLAPITSELIQEVVERIVSAIDPDKIILFGSFANGKPHEYSDLDLFIIKSGIDNRLELQG